MFIVFINTFYENLISKKLQDAAETRPISAFLKYLPHNGKKFVEMVSSSRK